MRAMLDTLMVLVAAARTLEKSSLSGTNQMSVSIILISIDA